MEIIKVLISPASMLFERPIVGFLPLFGFATNEEDAARKLHTQEIKVNLSQVGVDYVLKDGDLVSCKDNGIVVQKDGS